MESSHGIGEVDRKVPKRF